MKTDWGQDEGLNALTEVVIGTAYAVHNSLGFGFLEKVYENAVAHDLKKHGLRVEHQLACPVRYDGVVVGEYVSDLVVEGRVLVELKAIRELDDVHFAQCLNYLAATGLPLCLLINFGRRVTVERIRR